MSWIGIDVGGTFTDAVMYDARAARLGLAKAPTTPHDPRLGVLNALKKLGVDLGAVERFVHGLTLGTNAVLERKGSPVWMLTTRGFRDTMEIARTNRTVLYNIKTLKEAPLVDRTHVIEIDERILVDGSVRTQLSDASIEAAIGELRRVGAKTVAVCFLHSYANPEHERLVAERLHKALPECFVCTSSDVLSEFREYERFSTAALNAYIGPKISTYLESLCASVQERGYERELFIMTSSGGVVPAPYAGRFPVNTLLSGPAGGVAASAHLGEVLGMPNLITYDMGGTSTDVCLIENLKVPMTSEQFIAGLPNRKSQIAINSVGAGGGSIAWLDEGPALRVGPQSAAADPGPACYGKGGKEATVTDANVLLHRVKPGICLSGEVTVDEGLAREAIHRLRQGLAGIDAHKLAEGIVRIAVARMVSAIKEVSVSEGHDPREFSLLAYGGAGPMHAALIADELEMTQVLVPPAPGNFSAFGAVLSDLRHDYVRTRLVKTREAPVGEIRKVLDELAAQGAAELAAEGVAKDAIAVQRSLGMRYAGQSWEVVVDVPADFADAATLEKLFYAAHEQRYGHSTADPTEIVSYRAAAIGRTAKPALPPGRQDGTLEEARLPGRDVYFDGSFRPVDVFEREKLPLGATFRGPAIVEEQGSVTWLPPGWRCTVVKCATLSLTKDAP